MAAEGVDEVADRRAATAAFVKNRSPTQSIGVWSVSGIPTARSLSFGQTSSFGVVSGDAPRVLAVTQVRRSGRDFSRWQLKALLRPGHPPGVCCRVRHS